MYALRPCQRGMHHMFYRCKKLYLPMRISIGLASRTRPTNPLACLALIFCAIGLSSGDCAESHSEQQIEPGIFYWNDRFPEKPLSIHVVKVDRTRHDFQFLTRKAKNTVLGLATLTDQIKTIPAEAGTPKVAINGDFYKTERERYPGDPRGLLITSGELVSSPVDRACIWFDASGQPHMTNVTSRFSVTWPNNKSAPMGLNEDPNPNRIVLFTPRLGRSTGTSNKVDLVLEQNEQNPWLPLRVGEEYSARIREIKQGGNATLATNVMVLCVTTEVMAQVPDRSEERRVGKECRS